VFRLGAFARGPCFECSTEGFAGAAPDRGRKRAPPKPSSGVELARCSGHGLVGGGGGGRWDRFKTGRVVEHGPQGARAAVPARASSIESWRKASSRVRLPDRRFSPSPGRTSPSASSPRSRMICAGRKRSQ
jgi:hypothetical protein